MPRKKKAQTAQQEDQDAVELGTWMVAAYVLVALDVMPKDMHEALDFAATEWGKPGVDWKDGVAENLRAEYGLDESGIQAIFTACTQQMDGMHSLLFVLRGIGIALPIQALIQFLGKERLQLIGDNLVREHPRKKT